MGEGSINKERTGEKSPNRQKEFERNFGGGGFFLLEKNKKHLLRVKGVKSNLDTENTFKGFETPGARELSFPKKST